VQGVVRDEKGKPFSGAALRINGALVYSDDSGRFLYRCRKRTLLKFEVVPDEFLVPGFFQAVHAPREVMPQLEDRVRDVSIVVEPVRTTPIELRPAKPPNAAAASSPSPEPAPIPSPSPQKQ
jgi:hypothetical protein